MLSARCEPQFVGDFAGWRRQKHKGQCLTPTEFDANTESARILYFVKSP